MTGGSHSAARRRSRGERSVELLDLASNTQRRCTLGDLPDDRFYHTQADMRTLMSNTIDRT